MSAAILIPLPPSANNLFVNRKAGGRFISKTYRTWMSQAGRLIAQQRPAAIKGDVNVVIDAARPSRRRDLDNIIKPTLDLLVQMGVIADDRHVTTITAAWSPSVSDGMSVTVSEARP